QGWRVAPASGKESWELLASARRAGEDSASRSQLGSVARRTSSTGASRTFIDHHARRADRVARRAGAKSI
ncbi:hypothetical protein A2U01_0076140, partial [Trifolium medium]|nr:hypothetical protein [Trifolium medium]